MGRKATEEAIADSRADRVTRVGSVAELLAELSADDTQDVQQGRGNINAKPSAWNELVGGRQAMNTAMKAMRNMRPAPSSGMTQGITLTIASTGSISSWCGSCWGAWDMIGLQNAVVDFD
jgi:hypothetical protein